MPLTARTLRHRLILLLLTAFCLTAAVAFTGCAKKKANQLVIGMELSYPPFEMTDEHNQPNGIGVDMARALAASLHKDLVIQKHLLCRPDPRAPNG